MEKCGSDSNQCQKRNSDSTMLSEKLESVVYSVEKDKTYLLGFASIDTPAILIMDTKRS